MNPAPLLIRYFQPKAGPRLGLITDDLVHDISHRYPTLRAWFTSSCGNVSAAIDSAIAAAKESQSSFPTTALNNPPSTESPHWLPPLDEQEVWAAGVTYVISREARQEEAADGGDVYARVYDAERPEIFFKAAAKNTVGPLDSVGIRRDSHWNVPEPELALAINPDMELLGFTIGNDMSSREIEGANPLYLPQAKIYTASCALGPGILLAPSDHWPHTTIRMTISRANVEVFSGAISTDQIKRAIPELIDYLSRSNAYPKGLFLLTGAGIVPPADFTLQAQDQVRISIDGIGALENTVIEV